jgi:hypothetical protein
VMDMVFAEERDEGVDVEQVAAGLSQDRPRRLRGRLRA